MTAPRGGPPRRHNLYVALAFVALVAATVGSFAITRSMRAQPDFVSAVRLNDEIEPGERARIRFTLAEPEKRAQVLIVDRRGRPVRALARDEPLAAERHRFRWDGHDDAASPVPPGRYGLRVVLADADRDIRPPGSIRVLPSARAGR